MTNYYAYYQIDTQTVYAVATEIAGLDIDLAANNNINDINKESLNVVEITENDYNRIINGAVSLKDGYEKIN